MAEWLSDKKNLLFYTLFLLGLFFSMILWLTPSSRSDLKRMPSIQSSQTLQDSPREAPPVTE